MNYYGHKRENDVTYIVRIIVSFFVICISIMVIMFIVNKCMDIQIFDKINIKEDTHNSLMITTDSNDGKSLFITDDKGIKFRKTDKSFAREEWIEKNGELFYFDTAGYGLNGDLKKEGQVYTFENGKLMTIKKDTSYTHRAKSELYSSVESAEYLVWLMEEEQEKGFYPIMYQLKSDESIDFLGTANDKQYSTNNMLHIYMNNIYYLAVGKGTSYAGRLYRMRPGAVHKESVGVGVTGYVVLSDDVVYYCDGQRVMKAKNWKSVEIDELIEDDTPLVATLSEILPIVESSIDMEKAVDNEETTIETTQDETIETAKNEPTTKKANIKETIKNETNANGEVLPNLPALDEEIKIKEETIDSNKKNSIVTNKVEPQMPISVGAPR